MKNHIVYNNKPISYIDIIRKLNKSFRDISIYNVVTYIVYSYIVLVLIIPSKPP